MFVLIHAPESFAARLTWVQMQAFKLCALIGFNKIWANILGEDYGDCYFGQERKKSVQWGSGSAKVFPLPP